MTGAVPSGNKREGGRLTCQQVSCDIESSEDQRRRQLAVPQELSKVFTTEMPFGKVLRDDIFSPGEGVGRAF